MSVQLELSYLLGKNQEGDMFDSYLPLRIPIEGEIDFMTQNVLNAQAANALLGVWVGEAAGVKTLHFVRLAHADGLSFPDQTQPDLEFKNIHVRFLSDLLDSQGQRVDYLIDYVIEKSRYLSLEDNALPAVQWLALLTRDNEGFHFLHYKHDPGDPGGGGDPCVLAGCREPGRSLYTAIACIANGCG